MIEVIKEILMILGIYVVAAIIYRLLCTITINSIDGERMVQNKMSSANRINTNWFGIEDN